MGWNQVRWTQAQQVAALMGADADALPDAGIVPEDHFKTLRDGQDRAGATMFLGHALPRMEALAWAATILEHEAQSRTLPPPDRQALDHALRWLGDPSDATRRAAMGAADAAGERSPERLLALGVFFSGGSISDPDLPPVPPAPEIAGRFAAGAVTFAAIRSAERDAVFDRALDLGNRIANDGLKALEAA